ncbi:AMP-dependent synthetase/ligase [Aquirufa sp.]|jgi:long-chain acyl-CoA synthetase|uniref:AMP-dependent synthetase/ligase n=1 Tax=Aquirufa sp. TaxID=2676249 RepID=UPI0037C0DBE4
MIQHEHFTRVFDLLPQYQQLHKSDLFNLKRDGEWRHFSSTEMLDIIHETALGLLALKIKPGDKVAIISGNRPEWNFIDFAIQIIGAVSVPMYPTITVEDYAFIFENAEVGFIFVEGEDLYLKSKEASKGNKKIKEIYTFDPVEGASMWTEVKEMGEGKDRSVLQPLMDAVKPSDLLTLIYTSGTTGRPKGVMLTHHNIVSNVKSLDRGQFFELRASDKALSFLPLCHIYERTDIYMYMFYGVSVYYAESMETIADNIREVKPAMFATVPRLLEKVYDKIYAKGNELTGIKRKLFFGAIDFGLQYDPMEKLGFVDSIKYAVYNKLIFSKWREALGGNVRLIASGSAALQPRLSRVFWAAGVPISEGYGLTETSPVISVSFINPPDFKVGCVGTVIDCMELKIAEDGEICVRGDSVMPGYYKNPEATAEAIDPEGWFHTGDIGMMVDGKYLKITDRKKEIFKTSGGKYVAPQLVENKLKESIFIEQCMVVGEGQKFPSALVIPEFIALAAWCKQQGIEAGSPAEMIANAKVINKMDEEVQSAMASVAKYEQVKKFVLLPRLFTIQDGEITPTLKLKRKQIYAKHEKEILALYIS